MRRPVVFLFLAFVFGIALEHYVNPQQFLFFVFAVVFAAGCGMAKAFKPQGKWAGIAFLFAAAVLLGSVYFNQVSYIKDPLELSPGTDCVIEGRIVTAQTKSDSYYQLLITAGNAGKRLVQVKGSMENPAEYVGKWAVISGKVTLPAEKRNPGLFDYRLYLKTKGVRVIIQTDSSHITLAETKGASFCFSQIARLKYFFLGQLENAMEPEAYGMMAGMLFGDRSEISEDTYEAFQKNGTAHILSVSGIHVGIVYLSISRLLGKRKTRTFYLITALMLIFYAALSEFSPSVVRAVVMILIHMVSKVSCRRYDFLSCTAASALFMLLVNPFYLFNAGFQLSYMAVFCLAAGLPWMDRRIKIMEENGRNEFLTEGLRFLSPLLIIQIGMAPLTAYLFNYFSVAAFLINIPIIMISGVIIPLGICLIPVSFLGGAVFGVGAQAAELLVKSMLLLNDLFYSPEIGFFNVSSPTVFLLLCFYGYFFFFLSELFRILCQRKRGEVIALFCGLTLTLSLMMSAAAGNDYRQAGLVFVDVGQGDCLHIRTPEGRNILIDGGGSMNYEVGKKILLPYLLKNGITSVDLAVITHLHTDHYLGISELAENMEIDQLGIYEANALREQEILDDTGMDKMDLQYLVRGDRIWIEKDIWIDVLYPGEKSEEEYKVLVSNEEDENGSCLIVKVYYKGITVLMTGDIGLEGEKDILDLYQNHFGVLDSDVLKIAHHGSRHSTGDDFLQAVSPKIAVFQVGKNNFGHPHPSVIEKCQKKGIMVYRNDLDGAIIFTYNEKIWNEEQKWHIKGLLRKSTHIKE